jgi:hypothetical protein
MEPGLTQFLYELYGVAPSLPSELSLYLYHVHEVPQLDTVRNQLNPVPHHHVTVLWCMNFNIILPSTPLVRFSEILRLKCYVGILLMLICAVSYPTV